YLEAYNEGKDIEYQVFYNDLAGRMTELTGGIMDAITLVLIAFAAISLVVSLIMIGIITYTSVLERTKEIGVLRALGARKKDITRVFDAETFILGVFSGVLGVVIAWLATFPINTLLFNWTGLIGVANLQIQYAVALVVISTILTVLGGHIPARMASQKDAVEALRSE
ncbi:TPA_asm: sulfate ABC transporter ATP-binding protein, partial [Listeria monocytogenes]|nr:sulfate ABC transporter ATP-binding protein [Listeria monocytogenes]